MEKHPNRLFRLVAAACVSILLLSGCMTDEGEIINKSDLNEIRHRSVRIKAGNCRVRQSDVKYQKCEDISSFDLLRVAEMRGVNGTPVRAIALDDDTVATQNYGALHAFFSRIPFGYGCAPTLQGIFPSPTRVADCQEKAKCDEAADKKACTDSCVTKHSDPDLIENYDLKALNQLIGSVRNNGTVPLWTAGYHLGDGLGTCNYAVANATNKSAIPYSVGGKNAKEQQGIAIQNPLKWAQVVTKIARWYNRDLVKQALKTDTSCNITKPTAQNPKSWTCSPSLFNLEFGRDPNGAGGFNDKTKPNWLKAYTEFSKALRKEFPWPANSVSLIGPSVVVNDSLLLPNAQSWLFDFVDHVVKNKLALSMLSFEVVASNPVDAKRIVEAVRKYADDKKLLDEGGNPIPLFVTSLRLNPKGLPATLVPTGDGSEADKLRMSRFSAYEGTFFAATKSLWQGMVKFATVGRVVRLPTDKPDTPPDTLAKLAIDSNLIWYPADKRPPVGTLKPAAWHSFWFNEGFLGGGAGRYAWCTPGSGSGQACKRSDECKTKTEVCGAGKCQADCSDVAAEKRRKSIIQGIHGPDAVGIAGPAKSNEKDHLIVLATRENCVDVQGKPLDCVIETDAAGNLKPTFPAVTSGRKHIIRVLVSDLDIDATSKKEVLEHRLTVRVEDLPKDLNIKTVGYRWARMNGNRSTWCSLTTPHNCIFEFPEQGVLDATDEGFSLTRSVAVPSLHYFEFLY